MHIAKEGNYFPYEIDETIAQVETDWQDTLMEGEANWKTFIGEWVEVGLERIDGEPTDAKMYMEIPNLEEPTEHKTSQTLSSFSASAGWPDIKTI